MDITRSVLRLILRIRHNVPTLFVHDDFTGYAGDNSYVSLGNAHNPNNHIRIFTDGRVPRWVLVCNGVDTNITSNFQVVENINHYVNLFTQALNQCNNQNQNIHNKYLKYKNKYLALKKALESKNMIGGGNKVEVILFKADWCGHCKRFKPVWEQLQKQFASKFTFTTYDADANKDKLEEYKVDGFPTILFKDGAHVKPYEGSREFEELSGLLDNLVPV